MNVRPRTEADFESLEECLRNCHAEFGWPLEDLPNARAFIIDDHAPLEQAWVAECEGEIVGHIAITSSVPENPAVAMWKAQGGTDNVAVVGRLFVHPKIGKARGVTRALVTAVDDWARRADVWLIMYCVVYNAARQLMCRILTSRFGWIKYADTAYHSSEGWTADAVCYAAPRRGMALGEVETSNGSRAIIENFVLMKNVGLWALRNKLSIWLRRSSQWCKFTLSSLWYLHWLQANSGK